MRSSLAAAALLLAAGALPAHAGDDFNPMGDGSGFNNPDLLRGPPAGCENCAPEPPHEWNDPWFDLDWSLALRGSYVHATGGDTFEATAVPSVTLSHETLRGGYDFSASAEIGRSTVEDVRLRGGEIGFSGNYRLDSQMLLAGSANLALTQESASAPGTDPSVAVQPLVIDGDAEASLEREFGPLVFTGRLNAARTINGPTTLVDSSTVDNTHQNNWVFGGGLRVGYRVTPILTAFIDGSADYQAYDAASPIYGVKLDATDYQARTGLSAKWNEVWEGEASVGYGIRRFADTSLGQASSLLYDASVTFRPDETLEIKGAFTTDFGAPGPDTGGTARLEYAAAGDIGYRVNPWLKLRATAGWRHADLIGTANTEDAYNVGVGADYVLNEFATLTGDYAYSYGIATPNPAEDEHRITLGVTLSR